MKSFELATMAKTDLPTVLALLERMELVTSGVLENGSTFFVARANGDVIGCAGLEAYGPSGLLRSVATDSARRGEGVAAALVDRIVDHAAREGLVTLYLLTTTARAYFERMGFEVCSRAEAPSGIRESWEFRSGCPATAIFMRRAVTR